MRITLYVPDADKALLKKAKSIAKARKTSISAIFVAEIRRFVEGK